MPTTARPIQGRLMPRLRLIGGRQRGRDQHLDHLAGKDRFEGGFEPAMGFFQRVEAAGDHLVLLEHLVDGAGLLARELAVDIGHQQFVTELGHGRRPVASSRRASR